MQTDVWTYRDENVRGASLAGFEVQARDGGIGHVDRANDQTNRSYLVIDTGPWIFGKTVVLPAGTVERVDIAGRKVYVALTKDHIKAAPQLEEAGLDDDASRSTLGEHYGRFFINDE
jgi:hypothetical protein